MRIALIEPYFPSTNATSIWVNNKHRGLEPCKGRERDLTGKNAADKKKPPLLMPAWLKFEKDRPETRKRFSL